MGSRAIVYYLVTTILAAVLGIILVTIIHPGDPRSRGDIAKGLFYNSHLEVIITDTTHE